jgi:uncharacterized membrane-anchored protein YjiN (DUF445 family)
MVHGSNEDWYIELKDTITGEIEICKDLIEYAKKIEELGTNYGGNIDEVKWSKAESVGPHIMDIVRFEMSKLQREIEEEIGESLIEEKRG